jgi:hypothetical protein
MVILPGDEGPFWMMTEQWQSTKLDSRKINKKEFHKRRTYKETC